MICWEETLLDLPKKNIQNDVLNKTILVTGAAGSIGSEIVRQLLNLQPKNNFIGSS